MINAVSLFANVGIGETYLKDVGINVCLANELLPNRCHFYNHLYPKTKMICGDITQVSVFNELIYEAKKLSCKVLIATPPCQGMSTAGKMMRYDARNSLIMYAINFAKALEPDFILFENVPQQKHTFLIYKDKEIAIPDIITHELGKVYNINYQIVNAADFGVPQNRKRLIFIMSKKSTNIKWNFPKANKKFVTVRDAIGDLPSFESHPIDDNTNIDCDYFYDHQFTEMQRTYKWHRPSKMANRYINAMLHTPTGHSAFENEFYFPKKLNGEKMHGFFNTFKRMDWDKPAPTITMQSGNIGSQENGHPGRLVADGIYSDARVLSIFELMRLTGLPDDWDIPEWASDKLIRDVIGEGIPPKVTKDIFKELTKEIKRNAKK